MDAPTATAFAAAARRHRGRNSSAELPQDLDLDGLPRVALGVGIRAFAAHPCAEFPRRRACHEAVLEPVAACATGPRRPEGPPLVPEEDLQVDDDSALADRLPEQPPREDRR